jgi:hypothetical protein
MSELNNIVSITISRETAVVSRQGVGIPCIAAYHTNWPERARSYTDLQGMLDDRFATSDPVYLAASAIWSQNPKPPTIIVGRRAHAPTQVEKCTPVARDRVKYTVNINGTPYEFTSDSSAMVQEIVEGLAAAVNATGWQASTGYSLGDHVSCDGGKVYVCRTAGTSAGGSGPTGTGSGISDGTCTWDYLGPAQPVTASDDDTALTLTADAPGIMFSLELSSDFGGDGPWTRNDESTDPGIEADLAAILLANADWYGLLLDTHSKAELVAAARWVEANRRILLATSADTACTTSATDDIASTLKTAARERTAVIYHPKPHQYAGAAWVGQMFPKAPGSASWIYKTLSGVDAVTLTSTQIANLKAKNCNFCIPIGSRNVTMEGKTAAPEWIDTIRFVDWLHANMQADVFELFINSDKVPYDEAGIAAEEAVVRKRLQDGVDAKGLRANPAPVVSVPELASISASDKNNRLLPGVRFMAYLAGAIHKTKIDGRVSM